MATLTLDAVRKSYAEREVVHGISCAVADGELVVVVGPSGCGKSTLLRMIAGLETITAGTVAIDGRIVNAVEPKDRDIAMVFQNYALYPHMSVYANMAYGLKMRGMAKADIRARVDRAAQILQLDGLLERKPRQLSGGQRQRVAMGRAIVREPKVFLFDEPLSNLDAKLRAEMRVELRALQHRLGVTSLYVTHDQEEALAISDRVIVMNVGRIEQIGTPEDIYNRPKTRFVADFVGSANLISGGLQERGAGPGAVGFAAAGGLHLKAWAAHAPRGSETCVAIRTAYIEIAAAERHDAVNCAPGTIRQRLFHGDFIQYIIDWPAGQLIVRRPPTEMFDEGATVWLSFAPEHCILLEA
jgi:ABC-type sugar transport system ATPase subunit